jgi:glycosyltransferase involved in cell wall biosynthesis
VLNIDPRAPESDAYIKISGAAGLMRELLRHAWSGWSLDVHTNGHNPKSWFIAFSCGLAAQLGAGGRLTLHSGLAPAYIRGSRKLKRHVVHLACALFDEVVCVNQEIAEAVTALGVKRERIGIMPAFLPIESPSARIPNEIDTWIREHRPLISATMFFRPEYGFEVLTDGIRRLRQSHPSIGCLIMGTGEDREAAEALVEDAGLSDSVYLAGDLGHELCLTIMAKSAAFVRPTFRDGDSISVREALALGVPVIATDVGTRPEGTILFEPSDVDGLVDRLNRLLDRDLA